MGGFSDNYECGYWGDDTPPIQRNKKVKNSTSSDLHVNKSYVERSDTKYCYLDVRLTPIDLLSDGEQEERINLTQLCSIETALELIESKGKRLELYSEEIFIGSVVKIFEEDAIDNTKIVDNFCFEDDMLKKVEAFWSGETFYLRCAL